MKTGIIVLLLFAAAFPGLCHAQQESENSKLKDRLLKVYEQDIARLTKENSALKSQVAELEQKLKMYSSGQGDSRKGPGSAKIEGAGMVVIESCTLTGKTLVCQMKIYPTKNVKLTLLDQDYLNFSRCIVVDDNGNSYKASKVKISGDKNRSPFGAAFNLIEDVKVTASVTFTDVSEDAKKLAVLTLNGLVNEKGFSANIKGIIITSE